MVYACSPIFLLTLPVKDYGYIFPKHKTYYNVLYTPQTPHATYKTHRHEPPPTHKYNTSYVVQHMYHTQITPHTPHTRHFTETTQMTYTPRTMHRVHTPHTTHTAHTLPVYLLGRLCYGPLMIWKCLQYLFLQEKSSFLPFSLSPSPRLISNPNLVSQTWHFSCCGHWFGPPDRHAVTASVTTVYRVCSGAVWLCF